MLSAEHGLASSLISGYHVAFLSGAAAIGPGIVLAFMLLRPRGPQLRLAEETTVRTAVAIREQAA